MTEVVNPGDNAAPPAASAAPTAPAEPAAPPTPSPTPTGTEPETNPGGNPQEPAMVPSDRLREETEKRHQAEARVKELEEQGKPSTPPQSDDDDLDAETEDIIRRGAKKLGLVSRDELEANRLQDQVRDDVKTLEVSPPVAGIPYVHKDVLDYAKTNNLPITSKAALQAAYKEMNWDKILEAERQRTIDSLHNGGGAEKPGSSGARPPENPEPAGRNPREKTKSRIQAARQKLSV